jgi:hypothetical protein
MSNLAEAAATPPDGVAPPREVPDVLPEPRKAEKPTHFSFEHAVFSVKEACFIISSQTGEPSYNVPLGDVKASLPVDTVVSSFGIAKSSLDAELLQTVKSSLKFVKEIRPGDSIPSELLNGTASWRVEPHHREIARARISVQLASWMGGTSIDSIDVAELETVAAMPDTKKRVQEAFETMAEKLGLGKENKQDVVTRFDDLAREMAYIESLRERFGKIQKIYSSINFLGAKVYNRERAILEEITRVRVLMKKPVEEIAAIFEQLDANTGDILNTIRKFAAQIRYIRETRDTLHQRFMLWDSLIEQWSGIGLERSATLDRLVRVTYQFAARHFPQANDWGLTRG